MESNATQNDNHMNSTASAVRSDRPLEPPLIWYWILRSLISLSTVLGNGVIIYLISTKNRLQSRSNWFVLSLAVADFSIGAFVTPSGLVCSFWGGCNRRVQVMFYNSLLFSSTSALWMLTLDRYIAVVKPLRYVDIMTDCRCRILIALSWCCSFLVAFLRLAFVYNDTDAMLKLAYRLTLDLVYGFLSCLGLSLAYFRILCLIRRHVAITSRQRVSLAFNRPSSQAASRAERERVWAKVLGVVVLVFVCCYGLNVKISFCSNFNLCTVSAETALASLLLVHLNSALNFVVYALFKKDIRRELRRAWRRP